MTTRERVIASRLILKIDDNKEYANKVGLIFTELRPAKYSKNDKSTKDGDAVSLETNQKNSRRITL